MVKKFTKNDFVKKLGRTEDEAELIMKAQRMFPELLTDDTDSFVIDARNLWKQLGEPNGRFNDWVKRKLTYKSLGKDEKDILMFNENVDYKMYVNENKILVPKNAYLERQGVDVLDGKYVSQLGYSIEYKLTLDCGKNVAMMENTSKGALCRKYFILMEKTVKDMKDWMIIREPQKEGYKSMCKAVDENFKVLHDGNTPTKPFVYITNADMINLSLFGYKSKKMKEILDVEYNEPLRDSLVLEANKALYELQQLNENLLYSNIDFQTRKEIIKNTCNAKYLTIRTRITSEFCKEISSIK